MMSAMASNKLKTQLLRMAVGALFGGAVTWAFLMVLGPSRRMLHDPATALALVAGVVPGARLGARVTIGGSEQRLRILTGVLYTILALAYGTAELRAR